MPNRTKSLSLNNQSLPQQNGFPDHPSKPSITMTPNSLPRISSPVTNHNPPSTEELNNIKPLMAEPCTNGTVDAFDEFRRMAAQIHQQFNAPYSKIINAASSISSSVPDPTQNTDGNDKNLKKLPTRPITKAPTGNAFFLQWKVEHTAGILTLHLIFTYSFIFHLSTQFLMYDTISNTKNFYS